MSGGSDEEKRAVGGVAQRDFFRDGKMGVESFSSHPTDKSAHNYYSSDWSCSSDNLIISALMTKCALII